MKLLGDYHTHTKYSRYGHGKGTVLENASVASSKGLKQIAITDHGFNHPVFGIRRKDIENLKEDITTKTLNLLLLQFVVKRLKSHNQNKNLEKNLVTTINLLFTLPKVDTVSVWLRNCVKDL